MKNNKNNKPKIGNIELHIKYPFTKGPAFVANNGCVMYPLAYLRKPKGITQEQFLAFINSLNIGTITKELIKEFDIL